MLKKVFILKGNITNKDDCQMFFGDTPMAKDNHGGGRVDILLYAIVRLKLASESQG